MTPNTDENNEKYVFARFGWSEPATISEVFACGTGSCRSLRSGKQTFVLKGH